MMRFPRWAPVAAVVMVVLLLMVPVPAAAAPSHSGVQPSSSGTSSWAYGVVRSEAFAGQTANGTFSIRAYFGWSVVLTESDTSSASIVIEAVRTVGATVYVNFCQPKCPNPMVFANFTYRGWEQSIAFANFTDAGAVVVNGTQLPALAIENAQTRVIGNITEQLSVNLQGSGPATSNLRYFSVQAGGDSSVSYSPALGLLPVSVHSGLTWNATSNYTAAGNWSARYLAFVSTDTGTTVLASGAPSASLSGTGSVTVFAADVGAITLSDGAVIPIINLGFLAHEFDAAEGFIFIPTDADLFGGSTHTWSTYQSGNTEASTAQLDIQRTKEAHLGLLASASTYATAEAEPTPTPMGLQPTQAATGPTTLQAQPQSVSDAQSTAKCLISGGCVPSLSHGFGGFLVAFGVVFLVGLTIIIVIAARRRTPPPVFPNRALYPPAPPPPAPGAVTKSGAAPRPPSEEPASDPLGNLW